MPSAIPTDSAPPEAEVPNKRRLEYSLAVALRRIGQFP
jgi:hypothetical protein